MSLEAEYVDGEGEIVIVGVNANKRALFVVSCDGTDVMVYGCGCGLGGKLLCKCGSTSFEGLIHTYAWKWDRGRRGRQTERQNKELHVV